MAGPGAATQDMGAASHSRSCLVLQPVELLHCPHQRRDGTITLWEHYIILQWLPVKSFLISSSSKENTELITKCTFLIKRPILYVQINGYVQWKEYSFFCGWIYSFIFRNIKNATYIDNDLNASLQ